MYHTSSPVKPHFSYRIKGYATTMLHHALLSDSLQYRPRIILPLNIHFANKRGSHYRLPLCIYLFYSDCNHAHTGVMQPFRLRHLLYLRFGHLIGKRPRDNIKPPVIAKIIGIKYDSGSVGILKSLFRLKSFSECIGRDL